MNLDKFTIKLQGLQNIDLEKPLTQAAILVENDAKINCPVDTGQLRNSITHEANSKEATIGTNTEYAAYVELGTGLFAVEGNGRQTPWVYQDSKGEWHYTVGQLPQPFLEPALTSNKKKIELIFKDYVKLELNNNA